MTDTVFRVREQLQDELLALEQAHWVFVGISADRTQRLRNLIADSADRRTVQDNVLAEADGVCHLMLVHHQERRVEKSLHRGTLLWIYIEAARDQVKNEAKLILTIEHLGLCQLKISLLSHGRIFGLLTREARYLRCVEVGVAVLSNLLRQWLERELL